ncbi:hypothetical protein [Streptomyces sp. NPDC015414]|uniref:hypothetical protein n=1 Tax=Streptomyces sp. NPDC015414 TaxID=3364957 RepID=UPI0036FEF6A5
MVQEPGDGGADDAGDATAQGGCGALPDGWQLWRPLTPTAPEAALAQLHDIAPKTVVWLNETQQYRGPVTR